MMKRIRKRWRKWLVRFADAALTKSCERLEKKNDELESRLRIQQLELDELAAVISRNLKRVEAETAIHSRRIAECEGSKNELSY